LGDKRTDVVFVGRIKAAKTSCGISPEQPIGSDNWVAVPSTPAIKDEKVVAVIIKAIEIASSAQHLGLRPRS
jgi:hypothetical protein